MKKFIVIFLLWLSAFLQMNVNGQSLQFTGHLVYQTTSRIFFTAASDLDKDGDQDILFTQPNQNILSWFENQGDGNFSQREVGEFPEAFSTWVVDIDFDGDNDILASSYDPSKVVLFENDGNQNFTLHLLSEAIPHPLTVAAEDIDKDGDYDIACATQDAGKGIMLLLNEGNLVFTPLDLSIQPYSSTWTQIIDLDQDGDWDILGNSFSTNGGILWYEQTNPMVFAEHLVPFASTHGFTAADIDGDGYTDLAAVSCGSQLAWFRNDGNNNFTPEILTSNLDCAVSVTTTDLDLNSKTDLVASSWSNNKVAWWENDGNQEFTMQTISDTMLRPNCVDVADFNNDDFPDVVAGGYSGTLIWWENTGHGVGDCEPKVNPLAEIMFNHEARCLEINLKSVSPQARVILCDINGKQLLPPVVFLRNTLLPCDTLKPGLYLLKLESADRFMVYKIMIY